MGLTIEEASRVRRWPQDALRPYFIGGSIGASRACRKAKNPTCGQSNVCFSLVSGHRCSTGTCQQRASQCIKRPELGQTIPASEHSCNDHQELRSLVRRSGLLCVHARWSARLDIDCLVDLRRLGGLLDREMQHALVEMRFDGSVFRLKRQRHRSIE